jgi:peroxiredoxin Q/BCP
VASQAAFAKKHELPFDLLSDPDGSVAGKYRVLRNMRGRIIAGRVTFIIDDAGILRAIDNKVDVATHGQDLAKLITELQG